MRTQNSVECRKNTPVTIDSCYKSCEKFVGRSFKLLFNSAQDSIQYSGAFLVAAAVSHYFFAYATTSFLVISGTIFATRTVDKTLNKVHSQQIKSFSKKIATHILYLDRNLPNLATVMLVFATAISPFTPSLSIALSLGSGIYMGLRIENEKSKKKPFLPTTSRTYANPAFKL